LHLAGFLKNEMPLKNAFEECLSAMPLNEAFCLSGTPENRSSAEEPLGLTIQQ
jgi:hypothetical protein